MSSEKKIIEWESLSKWEMGVMVIMLPIFAVVAGLEHVIAKLTGITYNEVDIIVYYLLMSSVIICVVVPILIYVELIYAIVK